MFTGSIALNNGEFSEGQKDTVLIGIDCSGAETRILDCPHNTQSQLTCGPYEDAGIACQGLESKFRIRMCFGCKITTS